MTKPEIIQALLIASEKKYETDVTLSDGTVLIGQVEFVKKNVIVNGKSVVLDDVCDVCEHIESSIKDTLMEMLSECIYIKLKDDNEVINGYLMDCADETIEIVTTEGTQMIAIDNVEAVSEEPIVYSKDNSISEESLLESPLNAISDAELRFPFGGFEKKFYLVDFIDHDEKEKVLKKFCNFEYQSALEFLRQIQVEEEKKDELYEFIEYLQNVIARYEENEPKLKKEYGQCYYGGLAGLVEQNIPKCVHYYMKEINPWGQFGALALSLCVGTIYKSTNKELKRENAVQLMKYVPQMENIVGLYSQAQVYKSLLVIFASCEDWENYDIVLSTLVDILIKDGHSVAASNALLKYTKKLTEESQFDMAIKFAKRGFDVCDAADVLMLILYIEDKKSGDENIVERMKDYLLTEQIANIWEKIISDEFPNFLASISKSEYVDEYWKRETANQEKRDIQSEKNTTDGPLADNFSSFIAQTIQDEVSEEWESSFANYRKTGQITQARKFFKKKVTQFNSDKINEILARIEIWQNQFGSYKSISTPSTEYEKGMYKWFAEKKGVEAAELLLNSIQSNDSDRNTALFAYLDVMSVEYGFEQALEKVSLLRPYVKDAEKKIKIPFYEKVYSLAISVNDNAEAFSALNSLQSLYYSKTQLARTEYRIAGVYYKQSKWPKAKEHLIKASEYGFNASLTQKMLENVEKAISGEEVLPFVFEGHEPKRVDIASIKSEIEIYYDQMQYLEARAYIRKLCENNSDNQDLVVLRAEVEKVVDNLNNLQTVSQKQDNAGKAWRAWHIEENYEKAERFYRAEIKARGSRMMACLFDLSEMMMHVKGNGQGIACLLDEEKTIKTLDEAKQISFYEKLNIMLQKTDDNEKRKECLDVLMNLYIKQDNREKIAFTYYRMGVNSLSSKEYDDAINSFRKAIEYKYSLPTICYQYIVSAYIKKGDYLEAIQYAKEILSRKDTIQDNNLVAFLNQSIEKAQLELNEKNTPSSQATSDEEDDLFEDLMSEYSDKLVMYIINNPIIRQQIDTDRGDEQQKLHKYTKEVNEQTGTNFGTSLHKLTVLENEINGPTQLFYVYLKRCVGVYAMDSYKRRNYDSAVLWNMYMLSNVVGKGAHSDAIHSYTQRLLKCAIKDTVIKDDVSIEDLITEIMNIDSEKAEYAFRLMCFVIAKSPYLYERGVASYMEKNHLFGEQIYRFLNKYGNAMLLNDENEVSAKSVVDTIHERVKTDTYFVQMLISKFKSSRSFNEEYIDELRHLRDAIFVLENDSIIINEFISAYEKALEIYEYPDYENRLATVRVVQDSLININNMIDDRPTYFGIYYFGEIVDATLNLLSVVSDTTLKELAPELFITVPITEIETIDNRQVISVTVSNKENTAIATSLFISVYDSEGNELLENGGVELAPFLRGGNSKSIELDIKAIEKNTFSIRIKVQYKNHMDEICVCEQDETISSVSTAYEDISSNPYVDGKALDPNKNRNVFMGREALLNELSTSLFDDSGQCLIIYGQKRCGKTSISNFLQERVDEKFLIISFSAGSAVSASQLYNNVRTKFMLELQKKINGKNTVITDEEKTSLSILHSELRSMVIENGEQFIEMMRTIYGGFCIRYDKEILIIIDEFTHLYRLYQKGGKERDEVTAFMDTWKKGSEENLFKSLLIGQDTMPYIMAAYPNQLAITDPRRVDRLDDESVRDLIEKPILLSNGATRYMEKSVDLISNWFYGQPYYISVYCKRMVEHMKASHKNYVTNAMAEKVKNEMLMSSTISFFDNLINAGDIETSTEDELKSLPTYKLLCSIAYLTKNSEWASIEDIDIPEKERIIEDLINRSVIERRKGKCRIYINFFKEWLNIYGRE